MSGDGGFERFFRDEHPRMVALGLAMSGDAQLAKDVAQEAFIRAYRSWSKVGAMEAPRAWLRRVMINLLIDGHRRRTSERFALERLRPVASVTLDDPVADGWLDAVRSLPERQRAVVALHYLDDHSVADVAIVLGIAEGTVKASLAKARQTLGRTLRIEEVG